MLRILSMCTTPSAKLEAIFHSTLPNWEIFRCYSCSYTDLCQEKRFPSCCLAGSWLWQQGQTRKRGLGTKLLLDGLTPGLGFTKVANFCLNEVHFFHENFIEVSSTSRVTGSHLQTSKYNMLLTTRESPGMVCVISKVFINKFQLSKSSIL